jgi:hypothetical protein
VGRRATSPFVPRLVKLTDETSAQKQNPVCETGVLFGTRKLCTGGHKKQPHYSFQVPQCQGVSVFGQKSWGVFMPNTVPAKFLLGWMSHNEALRALKSCYFEKALKDKDAIKLWRTYRDKVRALPVREIPEIPPIPFTDAEDVAITAHLADLNSGPKARFLPEVIKVNPSNIIARQFYVLTDHSQNHGDDMNCENARIEKFLGIGLGFTGQLRPKRVSRKLIEIDLPHMEYVVEATPGGFNFKERDRYALAVRSPNDRLVLWGGYHRTHAVLCQLAGEAAAVAPLLTVMRGIPEVDTFFAVPSTARDSVLGDRPPLLCDFLDEDLFIKVNLRKKRAVGRVEEYRPGKFRAGVFQEDDDS